MANASGTLLGAILYCWMPHVESPGSPGPKFRPALIIGHDVVNNKVCVAPGTTQRLDDQFCGEFIITEEDSVAGGEGLHATTKFRLKDGIWLPLGPRFFMGHGRKYRFAGAVPMRRQREFFEALREAEPYLDDSVFSLSQLAS